MIYTAFTSIGGIGAIRDKTNGNTARRYVAELQRWFACVVTFTANGGRHSTTVSIIETVVEGRGPPTMKVTKQATQRCSSATQRPSGFTLFCPTVHIA